MAVIYSGQGTAHPWGISLEGHGQTDSVVITSETHAAESGEAYVAHTSDKTNGTLTLATSAAILMYIENTSQTKHLHLQRITGSSSAAGGLIKFIRNPEVDTATLANELVHKPRKLNFSEERDADVVCYTWDEVGGAGISGISYTAPTQIMRAALLGAGEINIPLEGAAILGTGASAAVEVVGSTAEIEIAVRFYFELPNEEKFR